MRLPFSQSVGRNRRGRCRPRYCWSWSRSQSHWAKINTHTHTCRLPLSIRIYWKTKVVHHQPVEQCPHTHTQRTQINPFIRQSMSIVYTLKVYVKMKTKERECTLFTEAFNTQHIPFIHNGTREMTGTERKNGEKRKYIDISVTLPFNKGTGDWTRTTKKAIHFLTE